MSVDPKLLDLTKGEPTAEEKTDCQRLLHVIGKELNEEVAEEWRHELSNGKCGKCGIRMRIVGYDSFVYCKGCAPGRYYCSGCKARGRAEHVDFDHEVDWEQVCETQPALNAQCLKYVARGMALMRVLARRELMPFVMSAVKSSIPTGSCRTLAVIEEQGLELAFSVEKSNLVFSVAENGWEFAVKLMLEKKGVEFSLGTVAARCGRKLIWSGPLKNVPKLKFAGAVVPLCRFGYELCKAVKMYKSGEISWDEAKYILKDSGLRNTGLFVGSYAGKNLGAALGFFAFGIGSVGAVAGACFGAFVGGFLGEFIGHFLAGDKNAGIKDKILKEAALFFEFSPHSLKNSEIFNETELRRRYKRKAMKLHPDRRTGDTSQFQQMGFLFGVLLAYLKKRDGGFGVMEDAEPTSPRQLAISAAAAE